MSKVTKKDLIEFMKSQAEISIEIMKLVTMNKQSIIEIDRQVEYIDRFLKSDNDAAHDEVIAILDSKEPKLKQLDQSVFDGLDAKWRFAAVDKCGEVWYSTHKTQPSVSGTHLSPEPKADSMLAKGYYDTTDWQNSLIERKELTGSDLARAMLERGDKYVMCMVDDGVDVIHDLACFVSSTHPYIGRLDNYKAATPINNQGEPLTAADVGL